LITILYSLLNCAKVGAFAWCSIKIGVTFYVQFERRKVDKKQTYMKTETCKLYSSVFWTFETNFIKIDHYNFELYRFEVVAFFWGHSVVLVVVVVVVVVVIPAWGQMQGFWLRCSPRRRSRISGSSSLVLLVLVVVVVVVVVVIPTRGWPKPDFSLFALTETTMAYVHWNHIQNSASSFGRNWRAVCVRRSPLYKYKSLLCYAKYTTV